MTFKKLVVSAAVIGFCTTAHAQTYDPATGLLSLPSVQVDTVSYRDLILRVTSFSLLAVRSGVQGTGVRTYDHGTRQLFLPYVRVEGYWHFGVLVQLNEFSLVSFSAGYPQGTVAPVCTDANLTSARARAIRVGMSYADVRALIGCEPTLEGEATGIPELYVNRAWRTPDNDFPPRKLSVWFTPGSMLVKDPLTVLEWNTVP